MENKLVKIGFSIFSLIAVVFGFIRLANNLHLSFNTDGATSQPTSEALLDETKQRITDTDADSLSDWEELNTYGTSPYLADSDSDGTSDAEEIKAGTDPNCPKGKSCGSSDLPAAAPAIPPALGAGGTAEETTVPAAADLNNLTPEEIRAVLKQGGATDADLQGATDEDLRKLFEEVISQPQ